MHANIFGVHHTEDLIFVICRLGSNIGRPTRLLPVLATIYLFAVSHTLPAILDSPLMRFLFCVPLIERERQGNCHCHLQVAVLAGEKPTCADEARQGSTYGKVRLPNLKVESVLRSQQPREKHDITIITQCSLDRSDSSQLVMRLYLGLKDLGRSSRIGSLRTLSLTAAGCICWRSSATHGRASPAWRSTILCTSSRTPMLTGYGRRSPP